MVPFVLLPPGKTPEDMDAEALKDGNTVYHLIAKGGVYLRHCNDLYHSVQEADGIPFLGEVKEFCQINFKPVPVTMLNEMVAFAKEVYRIHKGEAAMIMYYNKTDGTWKWDVPEQETSVGGLSVDYKQPPPPPEGYKMLGSCHSHGNAAAFQSGTDQNDELNFDGVHITIGNLETNVSVHVRLCIAGAGWTVKDESCLLEKPPEPKIDVKQELLDRVKPRTVTTYGGSDYSRYSTPEDPEKWFKSIIPPEDEEPPTAEYMNGVFRDGKRISPMDATDSEYDYMGEGCWWAGEYFIKIGRKKGAWRLLCKPDRGKLWKAWNDLQKWRREDIVDKYENKNQFRLLLTTMSDKCNLAKVAKKAGKALARESAKNWWEANKGGADKRLHEMSDDEYMKACYEEYAERTGGDCQ
ncbi:MAG: hypothetical protein MUC88_20745 [Planctomycetes bacterium]|jgi:PRTRC genetic system protein A|nr:hypothetical protein [Planctomycetota bacterium]